jgi:hypothetical protein
VRDRSGGFQVREADAVDGSNAQKAVIPRRRGEPVKWAPSSLFSPYEIVGEETKSAAVDPAART